MAYFAELNSDNKVLRVISINNNVILNDEGVESESKGIEFCKSLYGQDTIWIQTSYNNRIRKQFAVIGDTYDSIKNIFIRKQPYYPSSWTLDSNNDWIPPFPKPNGVSKINGKWYQVYGTWDEKNMRFIGKNNNGIIIFECKSSPPVWNIIDGFTEDSEEVKNALANWVIEE